MGFGGSTGSCFINGGLCCCGGSFFVYAGLGGSVASCLTAGGLYPAVFAGGAAGLCSVLGALTGFFSTTVRAL